MGLFYISYLDFFENQNRKLIINIFYSYLFLSLNKVIFKYNKFIHIIL